MELLSPQTSNTAQTYHVRKSETKASVTFSHCPSYHPVDGMGLCADLPSLDMVPIRCQRFLALLDDVSRAKNLWHLIGTKSSDGRSAHTPIPSTGWYERQ